MKKPLLEEDGVIGRRTLAVVVDETGQEDFKATPGSAGRPVVFGLAGVVGFGPSLVLAERRWRAMKKAWWGGEEEPLHASGTMLSRNQLDAVSNFFRRSKLGRFAYLVKQPPLVVPGTNALNLMRTPLLRELAKFICGLPALPDDIVLMFEHSERLAPKLVEVLPGFTIEIDGKVIRSKGLFTKKNPPQPLLEMCDQVGHRAQRQYGYQTGNDLLPEFVAVFPKDARHAHYREFDVSSYQWGNDPQRTLSFADGKAVFRLDWK